MDRLENEKPSKLLEIGPGPGALLYELAKRGWICTGLESSASARGIAHKLHAGEQVAEIVHSPQESWLGIFDWILAMEVLEHIEKDELALKKWRGWLKPGGRLLLSVPAHKSKWNSTDVWAGHYRRYERDDIRWILSHCGYEVQNVLCYGFPLSNIIEPVRAWHHGRLLKKRSEIGQNSVQARTADSGVSRSLESRLYPLYANFLGTVFMRIAFRIQRKFLAGNRGTGYLVEACRRD